MVLNETIQVDGEPEELILTEIDLSPWLEDGRGHLVAIVEPDPGAWKKLFKSRKDMEPVIHTWLQATGIGLDAWVDRRNMLVWANTLSDGRPLQGVTVTLRPGGKSAVTGKDGLARLPLPSRASSRVTELTAVLDTDSAVLRESSWGNGGWRRWKIRDRLCWYVIDDRKMYRPGEEVRIKGWIRRVGGGPDGDVGPAGGALKGLKYKLLGPQRNVIASGRAGLNAWGGLRALPGPAGKHEPGDRPAPNRGAGGAFGPG